MAITKGNTEDSPDGGKRRAAILRLEHGPLGKERAEQELMNWWSARSQN